MNRFAYLTTALAVKKLSQLSRLNISVHGAENIPRGSIIFTANHFTRIETLFLPRRLHQLTGIPIWSLADYSLFKGPLAAIFDKLGVISTRDPHRDRLMVKTLLTGEAAWVIYPEGRMVKGKKIFEKGHYMISYAGGKHPPHTGAATLALRTEFYRQRLGALEKFNVPEAKRLKASFELGAVGRVLKRETYIVPVNITYYPLRVAENRVSTFLEKVWEDLPERGIEEIIAESSMVLEGIDVDIRFGKAIHVGRFLNRPFIRRDIVSKRRIDFDDPIPARKPMHRIALKVMFEYMSAIYRMTTVNHDHLFASLLRALPNRKIDPVIFRRKVFRIATHDLLKAGVYRHGDLSKNQVHLLTDDRYNKYQSFLSLALDTGVVRKEGRYLVKDPRKFERLFDFHRVRVDDPIQVMANEVEPLRRFQRKIRLMALRPAFLVRRRIAKNLMRGAVDRYEADYKAFYREGESKEKEVGMPYLMGRRSRETGVLLVHGYMAAPPEVKELAMYLAERGFLVYAPRVRGHGTSPDDLATRTRWDWMESVDEGFAIVDCLCKKVVAGGFSTGAGLALDLGTRVDGLTALFAVSPPLRLQDFSVHFLPAIGAWNRTMDLIKMKSAKMVFIKNRPENPHINYHRNPVNGVRELGFLMASLERRLPRIKVPALVIQADGDPIVSPRGSRRVFERLGSEEKRYRLVNFNRHGILLGQGAKRVHRIIWNFVKRAAPLDRGRDRGAHGRAFKS